MPKNKQISEGLLSRLHGKGSMSEVLRIERERLLQKSQEEMRRQLSPIATEREVVAPGAGGHVSPVELATKILSEAQPSNTAGSLNHQADIASSPPVEKPYFVPDTHGPAQEMPAPPRSAPWSYPNTAPPSGGPSISRNRLDPEITEPIRLEGLSQFSRVVGDDLSEFGTIVRHSSASARVKTWPLPPAVSRYYTEKVHPSLPFTAQRNLLACVRMLTLSWGALSCQIPLDLLAAAASIRNLKTLRKWLADLQGRKLIRYTPVHGDLRGSVVTITPPPEIVVYIEQWWKQNPDSVPRHPENPNDGRDSQVEGRPFHAG